MSSIYYICTYVVYFIIANSIINMLLLHILPTRELIIITLPALAAVYIHSVSLHDVSCACTESESDYR